MEKNRILIVEDNKALAKLIAKKMEENIEMFIDVAHSFAEAQKFLENSGYYFITLLDLNLPDAPNGEIVDYVISKELPCIVLTGSIDDDTKKNFIHKDIVDYIYKGNMDDINYIFQIINRLSKNSQYKVMVVEDSISVRNNIKKTLQGLQFQVFAAAHGEEAMNYFNDNPDINLIITDYRMPVKDGLELLRELRREHNKTQLGIIAMTPIDDEGTAAMFLKNGANDFIAKPFGKEELTCRVNNIIEAIENINQIANFANCDFLTGVSNRRYFYEDMGVYLKSIEDTQENYALAMIDIDFFKKINDTRGHECGDKVIKFLAKKMIDETKNSDIVARFGGEEFCIVLKDIVREDAIKFFVNLRAKIAASSLEYKGESIKFTVSIGVAFGLHDHSIDEIIEMADEALYRAKEGGRNRVEIV
ncbi:diguanylate cyclase [Campylobacter sp. faydin G-105]|uniref:GGDEF domain-containing response regulator n=1 Tax=Campylobacter anatolicus TaxID=2829105 RepID=UPI001B96A11F|nr:diguanylate cyclase [Campylobacter anatolicus]MBR8462546.1 diguanylate cyclase [Campylobacter anatolicus]